MDNVISMVLGAALAADGELSAPRLPPASALASPSSQTGLSVIPLVRLQSLSYLLLPLIVLIVLYLIRRNLLRKKEWPSKIEAFENESEDGSEKSPRSTFIFYFDYFTDWVREKISNRQVKTTTAKKSSIADRMISDRPLMPGDLDPLGYGEVAKTISGFLRNENTEPPLTIAILGKWGTGKSSIMNLVSADLRKYDYCPVHFNAWYHQNEDNFLAALLEATANTGLPSWLSLNGLAFRGRLLKIRLQKNPKLIIIVLGLVIVQVLHTIKVCKVPTPYPIAGHAAFVTVIVSTLKGLKTRLNTALKPSSLKRLLTLKTFSDKLSFRHNFEKEFSEVTAALSPLKPVIIIDDLDRCKPENVVMVLEAVNFLVSAGNCFIILGMDREYVVASVAHQFKDLTEDDVFMPSTKTNGTDSKEERLKFAENYLEKLVNIEIPVPVLEPDSAEARDLVMTFVQKDRTHEKARSEQWKRSRGVAVFSTLLMGIIALSIVMIKLIGFGEQHGLEIFGSPKSKSIDVMPFVLESFAAWLLVVVVFLFLVSSMTYRRRLRTTGAVVEDSDQFLGALGVWYLVITQRCKTPRGIKRLLNKIRYIATYTRVHQASRSRSGITDMDESQLVALAVLHHCAPNSLAELDLNNESNGHQSADFPFDSAIFDAIKKHKFKFSNFPPEDTVVKEFQNFVYGAHMK